ncbi:hypothetical protein J3458_001091 [Metarhizium acridum]|uniref:HAUS augmin-like complex subunit 1 n=1 Tax=Metarhizium acridum (strain CQMa 102) TaxID=655827 RepID=E9DS41_METAQ|nr:uncharacterized protein MAC_00114 [Metarhizium acridum CQMa 102]EFY93623.1 hypothetical protein MAC_00114 [Metarhizium acridum CQMa 102]KAG8424286.1 hypothetical protein J3458_001091 [Metarhizium acridum]
MVLSAKVPPAHDGSAAIFSPSMARIAASTAKDWSYVDSWLASKFPDGDTLPIFERNPSTLKALLAVASISERADDSRHLLASAEKIARGEGSHIDGYFEDLADDPPRSGMTSSIREQILSAISAHLDQDGKVALDAMGDAAVQHGISLPKLEDLSNQLIALQTTLFETSQASLRADFWKSFLYREAKKTTDWLATTQSQNYQLPPELAKQNLDLQRKTKAFNAHLADTQDRMATCVPCGKGSDPTIQLVTEEEEQFLAVLSHKKDLDAQLMAFQGLPSDTNKARNEIDALRQKLRGFTSRRDEAFESLVEQASPVKRRP